MKTIQELISHILLTKASENIFIGQNSGIGSENVFGGQVLAQSVFAAYQTVEKPFCAHSLHSYFILPGNLLHPIEYEVEIIRNGRSFCTRRVLAKQQEKVIFLIAISFHIPEEGYSHSIEFPIVAKQPEECPSWEELYQNFGAMMPSRMREFMKIERPIEFRPVQISNMIQPQNEAPIHQVWFKFRGDLTSQTMEVRQAILAYVSDYNLLITALKPNASVAHFGNTQMASLDHTMWFHAPIPADEWFLYHVESPWSGNARGLTQAKIFSKSGQLIASVAQEGLLRPIKKENGK